MGLLDYLFDQSTYGGQGGLLSALPANAVNVTPSQGFPQQGPTFADRFQPAIDSPLSNPQGGPSFAQRFQPAADQSLTPTAPSIGIGSYQMPRIGTMADYTPQQQQNAALPQNAQPTQGQLPQTPQMQPDQQLPPALGGSNVGGNFGAGLQSFVNTPGGFLSKVLGGTNALLTGQRSDPLGMQQQNLKAQFDSLRSALLQNGESPNAAASKAMVAVMNPEAAKTIIPELFTNKEKYGVISEDPFAGKKYGFINERDQTVNGQPINAQGAPAGSASPLADMERAKAAGVQGEALYEYLPKQIAPMVKAMIEGRQPLPTGAAMRNPATLALIDAAHSVDPTFDATSWGARAAGAKDFTSGKSAEMVRAANQTLAHVGSLLDAMDNLKNGRFPAANAVGNFVNEQTGGGQPGAFRTNAHAVAEEMSKVFKGANLSDAEIRQWEQNLSENMSPEQQRTQIAKLSELLHGSLAALEEKRLAAIGPMAADKAGPVIKAEGQKVLERIDNWVKGNGGHSAAAPATGFQEGATATNPQTGQKITFRNGKWQ